MSQGLLDRSVVQSWAAQLASGLVQEINKYWAEQAQMQLQRGGVSWTLQFDDLKAILMKDTAVCVGGLRLGWVWFGWVGSLPLRHRGASGVVGGSGYAWQPFA